MTDADRRLRGWWPAVLLSLTAVGASLGGAAPADAQSGPQPTYRFATSYDRIGDSRGGRGEDIDLVQASFESERGIPSVRIRVSNGVTPDNASAVAEFGQLTATGCDVDNGASVTFVAGEEVAEWRVSGSSEVTRLPTDPRSGAFESALVAPMGSGNVRPELIGRPLDCVRAFLVDMRISQRSLDQVAAFALPYFNVGSVGSGGSDTPPAPADRGTNPRLRLRAVRPYGGGFRLRATALASRSGTYGIVADYRSGTRHYSGYGRVRLQAGKPKRITIRPTRASLDVLRSDKVRSALARVSLLGGGSTATASARAR